ncbi:hypothetical protein CVT25_010867 [Psilocybe cyanescens]|uniref:Uncharacterized protein n=1 Tax=Psilocybe cyanescens TaxID=93625 RepID=A0A409WFK7_PSICY|nr:hypothetical protein CVT25_010867 [Psilocybe cyanescens]
MTTYYPSQAGYATTQPMMGYPTTAGYGQYGMAGSYAQPGGVMYVPSHGSSYRHRRRRHHYYNDYRVQPQVATMGTPMVVQPTYASGQGYGRHYNHFSLGARLRRFFGLAPSNGVRYKSDRGTWGFMGYSRRQRYIDPRTGGEVDRHGRPVYRV